MHRVVRSLGPEGLEPIRTRYTPRWVEYYTDGTGDKPNDSRWREFHEDVSDVFLGLCGYCEELARGEVDHFRPKSKYPDLVYEWSNWIFSCHDCNHSKSDNWPGHGYVDPCAKTQQAWPERFFAFDTTTGEILSKDGLSPLRLVKAQRMIADLRLNEIHHLRKRLDRLREVGALLSTDPNLQNPIVRTVMVILVARETRLSSIVRVYLIEQGYSPDDL